MQYYMQNGGLGGTGGTKSRTSGFRQITMCFEICVHHQHDLLLQAKAG